MDPRGGYVLDRQKTDQLRKLCSADLKHLVECIEHAFTKPHYRLTELVPILVNGHHRIKAGSRRRIKAAIARFSDEDLTWVAEYADVLLAD